MNHLDAAVSVSEVHEPPRVHVDGVKLSNRHLDVDHGLRRRAWDRQSTRCHPVVSSIVVTRHPFHRLVPTRRHSVARRTILRGDEDCADKGR